MEKKWKLNRHQKSDQAQGFWLWMTGDHELFMTAQKEFDWFPLEHTETCFSCLTLSFLLRHLAQLCPSRWGHVLFPSPCQPCCLLENLTPRYLTPSTTFWTPSHSTCSQEIYACAPVWGMFENQAAIMPAIELCGGWVTAKRLSQFMGNVSSVKWKMNSKTNRQSHLLLQFPGHDYKRRESRFFHKSHTHTCLHTHKYTPTRTYRSRSWSICRKSLCRYMYVCCMCVHECVLLNAPGCCQLSLVGITAPDVYLLGRDDMHLHWRPSQQRHDDSFMLACHSLKYKCILQLWEEVSVHITDPQRWGCTGECFPNRRVKCWHTKRGVL